MELIKILKTENNCTFHYLVSLSQDPEWEKISHTVMKKVSPARVRTVDRGRCLAGWALEWRSAVTHSLRYGLPMRTYVDATIVP